MFRAAIDWSRPWLDSVRAAHADVLGADLLAALNGAAGARGLRNAAGLPLRFVPQAALPEGRAYEEHIAATGCVPTRENMHDYFNALVWLSFPRIKVALNALQAAQIARDGVGKSRGPARDGATIFDENAALLVVRADAEGQALVAALRAHDWDGALLARRQSFGDSAQVWLFGHALMEKLVAPRMAITAHTRVVWVDAAHFHLDQAGQAAAIDAAVAAELAAAAPDTAQFTPLPVLGVPTWWPGQDAVFYADASVFRPKRLRTSP